jgi:hypothetical protein
MKQAPYQQIIPSLDDISRFLKRVEVLPSGCWKLTTKPFAVTGYSRITIQGKSCLGHRVAYAIKHKALPVDLELDHTCGNRWCVNWDHLEPVSTQENLLRSPKTQASVNRKKTHCKRGHEFIEGNIYYLKDGSRNCLTCRHMAASKWYEEKGRAQRGHEKR